mmetsp:Transcript_23895/g.41107  ORF Transcript_23895/g.41107 Transcript_23895/m.41107 type:complete len:95 (-) Transcript_23895:669-953(-)|eukprot:CAMPEP_0196652108 /NCGR_PEP_ID=MMETSP1086-20130531/1332_1 /TAXON_ID=77921 /ORGANISM="Cyanoptyche  gloeocystis , Strain SAG4.97" /LENGTH=94 /DNA_ID=CAMNT_0041982485 /DNA_START=49 /DNA_END=333 /DNA_ORIENTATION=-
MAYISSSGDLKPERPWSLAALISLLYWFFHLIQVFFRSLIAPSSTPQDFGRGSRSRAGGGGSGSGGGGGGPRKRIAGVKDIAPPSGNCGPGAGG